MGSMLDPLSGRLTTLPTPEQLGLQGATTMARAPLATDDTTQGFSAGSLWIDTAGAEQYVCLSAAVGAAVWKEGTLSAAEVQVVMLAAAVTASNGGESSGGKLVKTDAQGLIAGRALETDGEKLDKFRSLTPLATPPSNPQADDVYINDGTLTASGNPGWRRYTGAAWEDVGANQYTDTLARTALGVNVATAALTPAAEVTINWNPAAPDLSIVHGAATQFNEGSGWPAVNSGAAEMRIHGDRAASKYAVDITTDLVDRVDVALYPSDARYYTLVLRVENGVKVGAYLPGRAS